MRLSSGRISGSFRRNRPAAFAASSTPAEPAPFGLLSIDLDLAANGDWFSNGSNVPPAPTSGSASVGIWANPDGANSGLRKTWCLQHSETAHGWWFETQSGKLQLIVNGGAGNLYAVSAFSVADIGWQYFGFSLTSTDLTFYHGLYDATGETTITKNDQVIDASVPIYTGAHLKIGGSTASVNGGDGDACEFTYWDRHLADAEQAEIYNGGKGLGYGDFDAANRVALICNYPMDEASGPLIDAHTGGHNLAYVDNAGSALLYAQAGPNA